VGAGVGAWSASGTRNLLAQAGHLQTEPAVESSTANFLAQLGQARRIMAVPSAGQAVPSLPKT
jgi:hypothetical protein